MKSLSKCLKRGVGRRTAPSPLYAYARCHCVSCRSPQKWSLEKVKKFKKKKTSFNENFLWTLWLARTFGLNGCFFLCKESKNSLTVCQWVFTGYSNCWERRPRTTGRAWPACLNTNHFHSTTPRSLFHRLVVFFFKINEHLNDWPDRFVYCLTTYLRLITTGYGSASSGFWNLTRSYGS